MKFFAPVLAVVSSIAVASTPKLPVKVLGGFLKVITAGAGPKCQGRIDTLSDEVAAEVKSRGLALDVKSPIAFAANLVQVRTFSSCDKLVVCDDKTYLKEGATVAIVMEQGHPVIYIDGGRKKTFEEAGIVFSDTIMKIAKIS